MTRIQARLAIALLIAAAITTLLAYLHLGYGFNLTDEGFFTYGTWRTSLGETPLVDFRSYEPARYYWAALFTKIAGGFTITTSRVASLVAFSVSLAWVAENAISGSRPGRSRRLRVLGVLAASAMASLWVKEYYISYHVTCALLTYMCVKKGCTANSTTRLFAVSALAGFIWFIGRNHGAYSSLAYLTGISLCLPGRLLSRESRARTLTAISGLAMGAGLPFLAMTARNINTPTRILEVWSANFRIGETDYVWAGRWPIERLFEAQTLSQIEGSLLFCLVYFAIWGFGTVGLIACIIRRARSQSLDEDILATCCTCFGYLHYTIHRPDFAHISVAAMPLVALSINMISKAKPVASLAWAGILLTSTIRLAIRELTIYHCERKTIECTELRLEGGEKFIVNASEVAIIDKLIAATKGRVFMAVPSESSLYVINRQKSPMWDIYSWYKPTRDRVMTDLQSIRRINPEVVIFRQGSNATRYSFSATNPDIYRYVKENYRLETKKAIEGYMLYFRKDVSPGLAG